MKRLERAILSVGSFLLALGLKPACAVDIPSPEQVAFFEEKIRPTLASKCYKCHSARSVKLKGGLHVDNRESLLKGGDSGEPALIPGNPGDSLFIVALRHEDKDLAMPPKERLPDATIEDFADWIRLGAPFPAPSDGDGTADSGEIPPWWEKYKEADLLPRGISIAEAVDHYVDARIRQENFKPAQRETDAALARRLTLDIAGRIPTWAEIQAFEAATGCGKTGEFVNLLLNSGSYARHMVNEFEWFLMGDKGGLRQYLEKAFADNKSWDKIFSDIILAEGDAEDPEKKELSKFLSERVKSPDKLTNDISVAFFGVNISCAQCHDHPDVRDWKQDHYYGMKSFFSRIYSNGEFISERDYGTVEFKTTKGEEKKGQLLFLDGKIYGEPDSVIPGKEELEKQKKELEQLAKEKKAPPKPSFSRRAKFVEVALGESGKGFLSRAMVNRMWDKLFGRGLVAPIDQMHGANLPSHPELLLWLARDFEENGYDLRRLAKGLAQSDTYARATYWPSENGPRRPDPALFAVRESRALTPEQYGASLVIASSDPAMFDPEKAEEFSNRIAQMENTGRGWNRNFPRPSNLFAVDVGEALFFSNNDRIARDLLSTGGGKLSRRIMETGDPREAVAIAFNGTLSRNPTPEELKAFALYITEREDRKEAAAAQVVWALLTSAEFRFIN